MAHANWPTPRPEGSGAFGWIAFAVVAPLTTYLVHHLASGAECGWGWSGVGGACRAILLVSIFTGLVAGVLARGCANAAFAGTAVRAIVLAVFVIVAIFIGTYGAKMFEDYRHNVQAIGEHHEHGEAATPAECTTFAQHFGEIVAAGSEQTTPQLAYIGPEVRAALAKPLAETCTRLQLPATYTACVTAARTGSDADACPLPGEPSTTLIAEVQRIVKDAQKVIEQPASKPECDAVAAAVLKASSKLGALGAAAKEPTVWCTTDMSYCNVAPAAITKSCIDDRWPAHFVRCMTAKADGCLAQKVVHDGLARIAAQARATAKAAGCLEMPPVLHAVKGVPIVCGDDDKGTCTSLGATPATVGRPSTPPAEQVPTLGRGTLCLGKQCKKVGAQAAAAISAALADNAKGPRRSFVTVTSDLALAAVSHESTAAPDVWDLRADRKLAVARPKASKATLQDVAIVGTTVIGTYACRDGSCGWLGAVIGRTGAIVGTPWDSGIGAMTVAVDRARLATLSGYPSTGKLTIVDRATGKHATLAVDPAPIDRLSIAVLSPAGVAIGWANGFREYRLARVSAAPGKPPKLDGDTQALPMCP
jgi:hypothetical protein